MKTTIKNWMDSNPQGVVKLAERVACNKLIQTCKLYTILEEHNKKKLIEEHLTDFIDLYKVRKEYDLG